MIATCCLISIVFNYIWIRLRPLHDKAQERMHEEEAEAPYLNQQHRHGFRMNAAQFQVVYVVIPQFGHG